MSSDELGQALHALLPYDLARRLEAEAPSHYVAPTGTAAPVDYEAEGGPSVALRVQELFGLAVHPALAGGRVPLTLHLLSPAHRPIQITRDLPGFWKGSWAARARRPARPLSPPFLAGRPGERRADHPRQAAGDVRPFQRDQCAIHIVSANIAIRRDRE